MIYNVRYVNILAKFMLITEINVSN